MNEAGLSETSKYTELYSDALDEVTFHAKLNSKSKRPKLLADSLARDKIEDSRERASRIWDREYSLKIANDILSTHKSDAVINDGEQSYNEFELVAKKDSFEDEQLVMNFEAGDNILREFIVDKALTRYNVMRFFNIGTDRYNRIKSGRVKKSTLKNCRGSGGRLISKWSKDRDASFLLFVRFAHRCFADDNEPLMKTWSGKDVIPNKPNVHKWKSVAHVFDDYLYFHNTFFSSVIFIPFSRTTFYKKLQSNSEVSSIIQQNKAK